LASIPKSHDFSGIVIAAYADNTKKSYGIGRGKGIIRHSNSTRHLSRIVRIALDSAHRSI
jgi:hypothetical protein